MGFFDRFRRKPTAQDTTPTAEVLPAQDTKLSNVQILDIPKSNDLDNEILKEIKMMYAFLINHDQRLVKHDQVNAEYLTQILLQNKAITQDKKAEVQAILNQAITENKPKSEAVKELMEIGITRATAYNYTRAISKDRTETEEKSNP